LVATLIGVWLGLMLLALYLVTLLLGYLTGALWLAETGLRRTRPQAPATTGWRVLALVVALAVIGLIGLVPVLGCLVTFAVLLLGLGALAMRAWQGYTPAPAAVEKRAPTRRRGKAK
jgi:hypothetical protein